MFTENQKLFRLFFFRLPKNYSIWIYLFSQTPVDCICLWSWLYTFKRELHPDKNNSGLFGPLSSSWRIRGYANDTVCFSLDFLIDQKSQIPRTILNVRLPPDVLSDGRPINTVGMQNDGTPPHALGLYKFVLRHNRVWIGAVRLFLSIDRPIRIINNLLFGSGSVFSYGRTKCVIRV